MARACDSWASSATKGDCVPVPQHHTPARPKGISLIAALAFLAALVSMYTLIASGIMLSRASTEPALRAMWQGELVAAAVQLLMYSAMGLGLWHLRTWGRYLAIGWYLVLIGQFLTQAWSWNWTPDVALRSTLLRAVGPVAIIVYLLRPTVAAAFHRAKTEP